MTKEPACDSCTRKSEECQEACPSFTPRNEIKVTIAIMSGKGGVGKSTVTALLAGTMAKKGFRVGILDGDITGPSIPRLLGLKGGRVLTGPRGMIPHVTELGIKVMSLNLFFDEEDQAVIWRGPLLAGTVKQFWEDVDWGELDFLFVDLPPGTGDIPLTVLQSLPLTGLIVVFSPQDLAVMVVKKAVRMARLLEARILGLIENMAYMECPSCGEPVFPFGRPQGERVSKETGIPLLATLPLEPLYVRFGDEGKLEMLEGGELARVAAVLENLSG